MIELFITAPFSPVQQQQQQQQQQQKQQQQKQKQTEKEKEKKRYLQLSAATLLERSPLALDLGSVAISAENAGSRLAARRCKFAPPHL